MSSLDTTAARGPDLGDYLALLRRRALLIGVVVLAFVVLAAAFSLTRTPIYEGSAEVVVQPILQDPFGSNGVRVDQLVVPETEARIVTSGAVAERVRVATSSERTIQGLLQHTSVAAPRDTQVLEIIHSDPDPVTAVRVARAFATEYLGFKEAQAQEIVNSQVAQLEAELDQLEQELLVEVATLGRTDATAPEVASATARQGVLVDRISQAETELAQKTGFEIRAGEIIDEGGVPDKPSAPDHVRNLGAGVLLGLLFGLAAAFLVDGIDPRVNRASDVEQVTGVAVLTSVPAGRKGGVVTGPQRDAYRRLGLVLRSAAVTRDVLMVASANDLAERRATAVHLAESLSRMGANVLLIDADVRRPGVHDVLDLPNGLGLVDVVTQVADLDDCVLRVDTAPGLMLLPAGRLADRSATILEEHSLAAVIARARAVYDVIVIDAPAIYEAADALSIQRDVDGVLLVAKERSTTRNALEELLVQFDTVNAQIVGAVLHGASSALR